MKNQETLEKLIEYIDENQEISETPEFLAGYEELKK